MTIETKTTKVLIVDDERLFAELLRVALRNADGIEVVEGVRAAALGEILFAPSELQRLLLERESRPRPLEPLTARELEVLQLLAEGSSTGQASEQLGISSATLRAHVQAILRKLGAHSRLEAVAEAARLGVITLDAWSRDKAAPRQKEVE